MPRYVCEGMMLRVDDPWAKDNNQEYWLDMNDLARVTDIPEEDISGLRNSFQLFDSRADAGRVKQLIVESAIRLLEKQKEEGTRPKGKTARLAVIGAGGLLMLDLQRIMSASILPEETKARKSFPKKKCRKQKGKGRCSASGAICAS